MLILNLGVIDQPYVALGRAGKGRKGRAAKTRIQTTANVARILEARYHVMQVFFEVKKPLIGAALAASYKDAFEALSRSGGQVRIDPNGRAMSKVETMFKTFISSREAERVGIPGTPTLAALRGVNHRLKRPYAASNPRRPSFRDSGLYVANFRSWMDGA